VQRQDWTLGVLIFVERKIDEAAQGYKEEDEDVDLGPAYCWGLTVKYLLARTTRKLEITYFQTKLIATSAPIPRKAPIQSTVPSLSTTSSCGRIAQSATKSMLLRIAL
jgi:hypothetical protein